MEHMAWKGRIKPGCKAEYQRRHAEIWPEMVKVLKDAGICNYSIFYCNDELFGYYECEKGVAYAEKVQAESPVVDRWNDYMKDILELEMDPITGAQPETFSTRPSGLTLNSIPGMALLMYLMCRGLPLVIMAAAIPALALTSS